MTRHETIIDEEPVRSIDERPNPIGSLARIVGRAQRFPGDAYGLGTGERAALARLDPDGRLQPHQIAALTRALLFAGLKPERWRQDTWRNWTLIAHGMALAGHDGARALGKQLSDAGIAESRVTRMLTARGDAFRQLLPRLLRLLASKETAPNWYELGGLILAEQNEERAEDIRMRIAGYYFSAHADAHPSNT